MTVTVKIDISTPTGRKLVRELEKHKTVVQITYPKISHLPEGIVTMDVGIEEFWKHLENRFGFDLSNYEKSTISKDLKSSVEEVVLAKQGKIKLKSADQLLNELYTLRIG